jgi:hypothetical protein
MATVEHPVPRSLGEEIRTKPEDLLSNIKTNDDIITFDAIKRADIRDSNLRKYPKC